MNHKLLLSFICLFIGVATSFAQNTLNVHQNDGAVVSYGFSEKPVVTYTETGIHLATTELEIDYPFANLDKFTFSEVANSIDVVTTDGTNDDVLIYNTIGVLLKTINQSEGTASFSTHDLPQGIYIIKNGKTTYKIVKK